MQQLSDIRKKLKCSMSEMAQLLGVTKSAYQGYETGRRSTPPVIQAAAETALQRELERMERRYCKGGEFDRELNVFYPYGIMSEI